MEEEQNEMITYEKINIYKKTRGRKMNTIITGLIFNNKKEGEQFMKSLKKKFGMNGSYKMDNEMDTENPIFIFTGDFTKQIIEILINEYKININSIKICG